MSSGKTKEGIIFHRKPIEEALQYAYLNFFPTNKKGERFINISGAIGSEIIGTIERIKSAIVTSKAKLEISIESVTEKQQSTNQSLTEQQRYQAPTRPRFR